MWPSLTPFLRQIRQKAFSCRTTRFLLVDVVRAVAVVTALAGPFKQGYSRSVSRWQPRSVPVE